VNGGSGRKRKNLLELVEHPHQQQQDLNEPQVSSVSSTDSSGGGGDYHRRMNGGVMNGGGGGGMPTGMNGGSMLDDSGLDKPVKKKRKRCGECVGCQRKDNCGDCAPCRNDKSHQICKMRRCDKLTEKKVSKQLYCFSISGAQQQIVNERKRERETKPKSNYFYLCRDRNGESLQLNRGPFLPPLFPLLF
jgi:hypothetical protein